MADTVGGTLTVKRDGKPIGTVRIPDQVIAAMPAPPVKIQPAPVLSDTAAGASSIALGAASPTITAPAKE